LHIDIYIQMDQEQTILMIVGDLIMCRGDLTFAVSINLWCSLIIRTSHSCIRLWFFQQLQLDGLQKQIDVALNAVKLTDCKWPNLDVSSWPVAEQFHKRMQTDVYSVICFIYIYNNIP
jgi:hypothetical protein